MGKIYRIFCGCQSYIGSTKVDLKERLEEHIKAYRKYKRGQVNKKSSTAELFDDVGYKNCNIVLLEDFKCETTKELRQREQFWIDKERKDKEFLLYNKLKAYQSYEEKIKYNNKIHRRKKECECGSYVTMGDYAKHCKSNKHIQRVKYKDNSKDNPINEK